VLLFWWTAGLVAAAAALQHRAQPPVLNLRNINPYVTSAVGDYAKPSVNLSAAISRGNAGLVRAALTNGSDKQYINRDAYSK
jgi:hypothetical protein